MGKKANAIEIQGPRDLGEIDVILSEWRLVHCMELAVVNIK